MKRLYYYAHSFIIIVAFFLSCFFFFVSIISNNNEIKMEKKTSMKTLNRDLRKKKHTRRDKTFEKYVEYGLKEKLF